MDGVMRILPLFIILLLFSAAIILGYLGWVAIMGKEEGAFSIQYGRPPLHHPNSNSVSNNQGGVRPPLVGDGDITFDNLNQPKVADPNDPENEGLPPGLITINQEVLRDPDLQRKVELLKMKVISKLRRHLLNGAKVKGHLNDYGVPAAKFQQPKGKKVEMKDVFCKVKQIPFQLIHAKSSPIFTGKPFPDEGFLQAHSDRGRTEVESEPIFKKCAVIPNSAALDGAKHGIDIDSHDFIIRFNNAPTAGYEDDVGSLTSLRIVNSQVVTKPQFAFPSTKFQKTYESLGKIRHNMSDSGGESNSTRKEPTTSQDESNTQAELKAMNLDTVWESSRKFLIWDPCPYPATLEDWVRKPDFPLFSKYFNLTSQSEKHERNRFYLLDCRVIWRLWEILQEHSFVKIYGNPPTSGFIGIMMALRVCERVNVYEYIPSIRESSRCHYYGPKNYSNPSCTYGSWHPVSAEKLFFLSISDGTDKEIFMEGVLSLPGVSKFNC